MNEIKTDQKCPVWAVTAINQMKLLEIRLGNVTESAEYKTKDVEELNAQTFGDGQDKVVDSNMVDQLFSKVSRELAKEGFTPKQISGFINEIVVVEGSLTYCDEKEVRESLD